MHPRPLIIAAVAAAASLSSLLFSSVAFANSWRAMPTLDPSSPLLCRQADVSKVVIEFSASDSELTVRTAENGVFAVPIAFDGFINGAIALPVGQKRFAVDLTGNVRDRALQIYNKEYSCRFHLRPTQ